VTEKALFYCLDFFEPKLIFLLKFSTILKESIECQFTSSIAGSAERALSSSCSHRTLMISPCARPAVKMTRSSLCPRSLAVPRVRARAKVQDHTLAPLMAAFPEGTEGSRELLKTPSTSPFSKGRPKDLAAVIPAKAGIQNINRLEIVLTDHAP
jgi:hypothetical protein